MSAHETYRHSHRQHQPSWWAVIRATARVHGAVALIPLATAVFLAMTTVVGLAVAHR